MTDLEQKLKADLNDEQFNAAMHMKDPAVVISGAGSGKTAVLVQRVIDRIVDPDHPSDVDRLLIVTLHPLESSIFVFIPRPSFVEMECSRYWAQNYAVRYSLV